MQRFIANFGDAWREGDLKINDQPVAHVVDEKSSGDAFRDLEAIAEEVEKQTARPIAKKFRRRQPKVARETGVKAGSGAIGKHRPLIWIKGSQRKCT